MSALNYISNQVKFYFSINVSGINFSGITNNKNNFFNPLFHHILISIKKVSKPVTTANFVLIIYCNRVQLEIAGAKPTH